MGLRILIAEEDDSFRCQLASALAGHDVVEAASGDEALESLREDPFPLVIAGMQVGGASGLELLETAKAGDPRALVVVTVDPADSSDAARALRSGAHDYLVRSCEEEVLTAVLRRAVEQVTLIRENQALLSSLKQNVEALGRQNRRLEHLATRDGLTGLYNHRYLREAFEVELSRCRRYGRVLSIVFADIDYFKEYNDTHGHLAGDTLLSTLGEVISSVSRQSTIVARYGGEEFVLLAPETDHAGALHYAEKIRSVVESHPFDDCESVSSGRITLSMGVATFPEHGADADSLIKYADDALYRAKENGRNQVCG